MQPALGFFDGSTDLTDPGLYATARAAFGEATSLPAAAYRAKSFSDLEDEQVWTRSWVCAGNHRRIPRCGDLLPFTVGHHGTHLRRQDDGTLRAFFNFAQHGGCRYVPRQCQTGTKTSCFYTSCGQSLDRDVIPMGDDGDDPPEMYMYKGINPDKLIAVRSRVAGSLAFVDLDVPANFAANADPVGSSAWPALGTLLEGTHGPGEHETRDIAANWKIAAPWLLQHLSPVPRGTLPQPGDPATAAACSCAGVADSGDGTFAWNDAALLTACLPGARAALWWYPNLLLFVDGPALVSLVVQPTGLARTRMRSDTFRRGAGMDPGAGQALRSRVLSALDELARASAGLQIRQAGGDDPSPFLPQPRIAPPAPPERNPFAWTFHQQLLRDLLQPREYVDRPLYSHPGRSLNAGVNAGTF